MTGGRSAALSSSQFGCGWRRLSLRTPGRQRRAANHLGLSAGRNRMRRSVAPGNNGRLDWTLSARAQGADLELSEVRSVYDAEYERAKHRWWWQTEDRVVIYYIAIFRLVPNSRSVTPAGATPYDGSPPSLFRGRAGRYRSRAIASFGVAYAVQTRTAPQRSRRYVAVKVPPGDTTAFIGALIANNKRLMIVGAPGAASRCSLASSGADVAQGNLIVLASRPCCRVNRLNEGDRQIDRTWKSVHVNASNAGTLSWGAEDGQAIVSSTVSRNQQPEPCIGAQKIGLSRDHDQGQATYDQQRVYRDEFASRDLKREMLESGPADRAVPKLGAQRPRQTVERSSDVRERPRIVELAVIRCS